MTESIDSNREPLREPLRFERHFVEKVWGGRALARTPGIELPGDDATRIGETWEIVDRENENSVVAEGRFAGRTLRELMLAHGRDILGDAAPGRDGRFPLLVKYLDASQDLSVQVHPDDETQDAHPDAEAKTEAWYVLDVAPSGVLYAGLQPDVTPERFASIAADPNRGEVVDCLRKVEVEPGDAVLIEGGTVHAIGAGVTILEVQQNSDTTYRLYDWDRAGLDGEPRETHVTEALPCVKYGVDGPDPVRREDPIEDARFERSLLVQSHVFTMESLRIRARVEMHTDSLFRIYAVVAGAGELSTDATTCKLSTGDVWLVPASCGAHAVTPDPEHDTLELIEMAPAR